MITTRGFGQYSAIITRGFGKIVATIYTKFKKKLVLIGQKMNLIGKEEPAFIKPRKIVLISGREKLTLMRDEKINLLSKGK